MDVLFDAHIPMHHQIYNQLKAEIMDGMWIGRPDFPGEEEVALRYGVSVITSRQALVRLVADGLLKRERGRRPQAIFVPSAAEDISSPSLFPTFPRHPYIYEIVETDVRVAHTEACAIFGLDHGAPSLALQSLAALPRAAAQLRPERPEDRGRSEAQARRFGEVAHEPDFQEGRLQAWCDHAPYPVAPAKQTCSPVPWYFRQLVAASAHVCSFRR